MVRHKCKEGTIGILASVLQSISLKSLKINRKLGKQLSELEVKDRDLKLSLGDPFPNELFQNATMTNSENTLN